MIIYGSKTIDTPIQDILFDIRRELHNRKLKVIDVRGTDITVTCPCSDHKGGQESNPDCHITINENSDLEYGTFHCFGCGESGSFAKFVSKCFECSVDYAKQWLINKYGVSNGNVEINLEPISFKREVKNILDENVLNEMQEYHPYMLKRKLDLNICKLFKVKYDSKSECLAFPVFDERNKLTMITRRSVNNKMYLIPSNVEKPVYLLNEIIKRNIKTVCVCESQINALYVWSLGYPSVALFGTGSKHQYDILNKSGIEHYILCFDGDDAGDKGSQRFIDNINKQCFIDVIKVPRGKDMNDLSQEEVDNLLNTYIRKVELC